MGSKLEDPTRMPLEALSTYWNEWAFKAQKGDPFSFLGLGGGQDKTSGGNDNQSQYGGSGDDEKEVQIEGLAPHFSIDDNILSPHACSRASSDHTSCLLALVTGQAKTSKTFGATVRLVDSLEVSWIENMVFFIKSYKILG